MSRTSSLSLLDFQLKPVRHCYYVFVVQAIFFQSLLRDCLLLDFLPLLTLSSTTLYSELTSFELFVSGTALEQS